MHKSGLAGVLSPEILNAFRGINPPEHASEALIWYKKQYDS